MKKRLFTLLAIVSMYISVAQVGIGTTNPTSELEIATTDTGLPALELNPQTAPTGTTTGQLAVIGNKLFMFDATRGKWLSVAETAIQFARDGNVNTQTLRFGGDMVNGGLGPLMPRNGTIVAITATTFSNSTKSFELRVRNYNPGTGATTTTQSHTFSLTNFEHVDQSLNIDFNANHFITVRGSAGGNAQDPAIMIWVKWRE